MADLVAQQHLKSRARLARQLLRAFPGASEQEVEDALSEALLVILSRMSPSLTTANGLIYKIAWRQLRGEFRRHSRRFNVPIPRWDEPALGRDAPQDVVLSASRWVRVFERTIDEHGKTQADPLRRALLDKLETGDHDGLVAERHGVTRGRLNRAWNHLLDAMLEG